MRETDRTWKRSQRSTLRQIRLVLLGSRLRTPRQHLGVAQGPVVFRSCHQCTRELQTGQQLRSLDFAEVGSCFSIRALGMCGHTLSVFNDSSLGSALSVRAWSLRTRLSVRQELDVTGASSLTSWAACMSCLSIKGYMRMNGVTSVLSEVSLSSSLSVRSFARMGGMVSVQDTTCTGTRGASVTGRTELYNQLSVAAYIQTGSTLSSFAHAHLGSSLSVRSFVRIGSGISAQDRINGGAIFSALGASYLGNLCSIRGATSLGSTLTVREKAIYGGVMSAQPRLTWAVACQFATRLTRECGSISERASRTLQPVVGRGIHPDGFDIVIVRTRASWKFAEREIVPPPRQWNECSGSHQRRCHLPAHSAHLTWVTCAPSEAPHLLAPR